MAASYRAFASGGVGGSGYQNTSREDHTSQLPQGACNFRDLNCGGSTPVCGCERFWLNRSGFGGQEPKEFCFCGHHACYHSFGTPQRLAPIQPAVSAIQDEAVHHVPSRATPEGYYRVHQAGAGASPKPSAGLGIQPDGPTQSRSINTRVWEALNGFARNQDDGAGSVTTSKLPSTAVPSVDGDIKPGRPMGPPVTIPSMSLARAGYDEYLGSATEEATPSVRSIAGTPDLNPFGPGIPPRFPPGQLPTTHPVGRVQSPTPPRRLPSANHGITDPALSRDMENILQSYGRRLDVLESMSFSHVPVEEVQDKFEHHDVRLLDLEQWRTERDQEREREREEAERNQDSPEATGSKRRRLLPNETSSFASDGSFDSAAALHTEAAVLATVATNLELEPRFEALESRVFDLESAAMPSFTRPWEVQVVLLPWGSALRGIWFTSSDASQHSQRSMRQDTEEWSAPQSAPKISFHSSASTAWTTESIEAWAEDAYDWLSPKACGPTGTVFQRLASRGLVRDLIFTGSTSKHIMDTINNAFRKVLPSNAEVESELLDQYQGLREPLLPLRKVRKSSRLRFLSQAEMVTSAAWTADFLESSALMKTNDGQRRLYITTPHAYLQTSGGEWTWKTLRELPQRNARGDVQNHVFSKGKAIEACWSYSDKLDHAPSLHSSFGSSQKSHPDPASLPPHPMSPLSTARPLRPRTASLPSSESALKRRAASFEPTPAPTSSAPVPVSTKATAKRPRLSTSPEAERRGAGFTPRLSREPLSDADVRSQGSRAVPRGTTPFAYATPHSHSQFVGLAELVGWGEGDTELGTEIMEGGDEEWEGVGRGASEDGDGDESMGSVEGDGESDESEEMDLEDGDEDEGLTIYEQ